MKERGFNFIELILVVALISILGGLLSPFFSRFLFQSSLENATDRVVKTLRKASNYAVTGKQGTKWGVHYEAGKLILFKGNSYGEDHSFDEELDLPSTLIVSGWSDVTFSKGKGRPSGTLTITLTLSNQSKTVILNEEGMVDVE